MTAMILSGKNQAVTFDPATSWQEVNGLACNEASQDLRKDLTEMKTSSPKQVVNHASILLAFVTFLFDPDQSVFIGTKNNQELQ
ncbi:hypothetical protein ACFL3A_02945 [Pseudomonadota bacterium]